MIPDPIPLLADLEAEARRRGWTDAGTPNRWERAGALMADFTGWMAPPDRITLSRDTRANLDAALTAWATADAERLGWVRDEEDETMWIAPESYGDNHRWCVQGPSWWRPHRPDVANEAPDEPTAVRRALDAWLRAREATPTVGEAGPALDHEALLGEARRRGWTESGPYYLRNPSAEHEGDGDQVVGVNLWWGPGGLSAEHYEPDPARRLDAALTAWATADAERLGCGRESNSRGEAWWNMPPQSGENWHHAVQAYAGGNGWSWFAPNNANDRHPAPDEPTAVRRALDAWLRARETVPAPAEADRPASGELPAELVARAKAAGLERSRNPETDRPRWYLVAADYDRLCCWKAGDADGWYWTRRSDSGGILVASEADALRAWLDSREGAWEALAAHEDRAEHERLIADSNDLARRNAHLANLHREAETTIGALRHNYAQAERERDAATQEADRLRTRLVDAEAERDRLRRGLLTEFSLAEAELDRQALLAYLAYTGGCTHEGIGLPGCPTCEGRWTRDVRAAVHAHRDEVDRLRAAHDAAVITAEESNDLLNEARSELAALDRALGLAGEGRTRYHGDRMAAVERLTADAAEELHAYRDAASVIEELTGDASPGSLRGLLGDLETGCQWLEDAGICTEGTPYPDVMRAAAEEITALRGRLISLRREMARGAA
jgi:hypothetical protein